MPNVPLADPHFNIPSMIDIIIGGECYHEIHTGSRLSIGDGLPLLVDTRFGWTVSGKTTTNPTVAPPVCYLSTVDRSLESSLQRFWELEAVDQSPIYSEEEKQCEEFYATTTTRTHDGRYVVRLPRSDNPQVTLGQSRQIATRRFYSLERRLERDTALKSSYHNFIEEYLRLGHMRKLDFVDDDSPHCYLPHHPVVKESSTTTKLRVVFDASCKTSSGMSLNDTLLVGPVVQQNLDSIIIRFRFHAIAIVADVEKMYRQILHSPVDQRFLRILFRRQPSDPLDTYELLTVTKRRRRKLPQAVEAVVEDFYVDDLLTGEDNLASAVEKRRQISTMLESAGFSLKKWASNVPEALADVSPEDRAIKPVHELQDDQSVTTLGLVWDTKNDILRFNVDLPLPASVLTKRKVISYIAKIFDPLGLVGPVIATAKIFMQHLWKPKNDDYSSYEWDRPLPERLQREWKQFFATLSILAKIKIQRFVSSPGVSIAQLRFFFDASDVAYGACCYVRTLDTDHVRVSLLTSKSRVAPLATKHTTARLELCAAVLSTKLYRKVEQSIKTPSHVFFWTDSTTVIQWLQSPPSRWKTFVANRVSTIQSATEISLWRHVPGNENPADELSRGMLPTDLSNQARWWSGPPWLSEFPSRWPSPGLDVPQTEFTTQEARTVTLHHIHCSQ
ncbi:uncharacterized protein LOC134221729 [Armigeres subalbatus]|uniref:uncharacterized protein LOC134221729 n=1 Tax=Armigeres subalbatus TaxID=124917 RepID=UPI002ED45BB5